MAILEIVKDPAEVLRKKAKPVQKVNASIRRLLDDMAETMYAAPGVGLAAPQVGISKRVIVVDPQDESTGLLQLVNPEIIEAEGWAKGTEGCLSIPGYVGDVYRHTKVRVVALDRNGRKVWIDADGFLAVVLQHEIDHLDGILYTDKCTDLREITTEDEADDSPEVAEARAAARAEAAKAEAGATAEAGAEVGAEGVEGPAKGE